MMVARVGSVGAAARRLNKTPSAVSQQIRRVTDALGVELFERRGRGL
jgi:DNA-binding transcriptional LysR family regulator